MPGKDDNRLNKPELITILNLMIPLNLTFNGFNSLYKILSITSHF